MKSARQVGPQYAPEVMEAWMESRPIGYDVFLDFCEANPGVWRWLIKQVGAARGQNEVLGSSKLPHLIRDDYEGEIKSTGPWAKVNASLGGFLARGIMIHRPELNGWIRISARK